MKYFSRGVSLLILRQLSHYTIVAHLFIDYYMDYYIFREIKYQLQSVTTVNIFCQCLFYISHNKVSLNSKKVKVQYYLLQPAL